MAIAPIKKIVVPAAGFGARMLPATKCVPKELLAVGCRPVIHYIALEAAAAGASELIFVAREKNPPALRYLRRDRNLESQLASAGNKAAVSAILPPIPPMMKIKVVVQSRPRGLGDAILCARKIVGDSSFGVMLPDVILHPAIDGMPKLIRAFSKVGASAILVHPIPSADSRKYGIVDFASPSKKGGAKKLRGVVEKPPPSRAPSSFAITGRYVFTSAIFEMLAKTSPGKNNEIQLTDAIADLVKRESVFAIPHRATCYDCGSPSGLLEASLEFSLRDSKTAKAARDLINRLAK